MRWVPAYFIWAQSRCQTHFWVCVNDPKAKNMKTRFRWRGIRKRERRGDTVIVWGVKTGFGNWRLISVRLHPPRQHKLWHFYVFRAISATALETRQIYAVVNVACKIAPSAKSFDFIHGSLMVSKRRNGIVTFSKAGAIASEYEYERIVDTKFLQRRVDFFFGIMISISSGLDRCSSPPSAWKVVVTLWKRTRYFG